MTVTPLILLPPSEGKASGGMGPPISLDSMSFPSLNTTRSLLIRALEEINNSQNSAQKLLGVKGKALLNAMSANSKIESSSTMPAIRRYTGVMYDAIDYDSLSKDQMKDFNDNVLIMSGLFGVVRPLDMIPGYKLKMGARLHNGKPCSTVWKPLITEEVGRLYKDTVIWDLLPIEHSAAWEPSAVHYTNRFTVKFLQRTFDGKLKTISHWSKALKGSVVHYLVSNISAAANPSSCLELIAKFSHPEGYKFADELTREIDGVTEITFLKD